MRLTVIRATSLQACMLVAALALSGVAHAQKIIGFNQTSNDFQNRQQIENINSGRGQARAPTEAQVQIAKFMEAIKPRKDMYPDFDKVVLQGNAPVTPAMLGMISASPYAADIAYYLGQHAEQSGAIARMQPDQVRSAIKQIETVAAATNPIRK